MGRRDAGDRLTVILYIYTVPGAITQSSPLKQGSVHRDLVLAMNFGKWHLFGMKIRIDKTGRLVLPRSLRSQHGITPDTELERIPDQAFSRVTGLLAEDGMTPFRLRASRQRRNPARPWPRSDRG